MKAIRVVYIEDDQELVNLVSMILRPRGYVFWGATDGYEGLALVRKMKPDVVLLDLMIPDISGWDIIKILSADPLTKDLPVIVISAKAEPIDKVLGLHIAKVDGYICKPFTPSDLVDCIGQVIKQNRAD